jgi:hypothetical protein
VFFFLSSRLSFSSGWENAKFNFSYFVDWQGLQTCVQSTKKAGKEFPSVVAVQGMLDSVLTVSKLAQNLKTCLVQPIISTNGSK